MRRRRFGRTGIEVSALTFGCGYVGGILLHTDEETRLEALRRAIGAGCNLLDTAGDYGDGESEKTLGRLLPHLSPRPHVATKVRLDVAELARAGGDASDPIRRSLETSLERLKLDRVTLLQLHNPVTSERSARTLTPADVLRPNGIADIFDGLRAEGLVAHVGLTALGDRASIVDVIASGRMDTAQIYYNMLNPSAGGVHVPAWGGHDLTGVLDACATQDMGTMNIRVLAAGVLATTRRHGRENAVTEDAEMAQEQDRAERLFAVLGDRYGTRAQTALRFALAEDRLSTVVVGFAELAHLDEAIAAFETGPLPGEALDLVAGLQANGQAI